MENKPQNNPMAIAGMILGIVSVVCCWWGTFAIVGLAAGIVGLVLSVKGRKIPVKRGMATAGLVLSIIGIVCGGIFFICAVACTAAVASAGDIYYY